MAGIIIYVSIGAILIGGVLSFLITRMIGQKKVQSLIIDHQKAIDELQINISHLGIDKGKLETSLNLTSEKLNSLETDKLKLEQEHHSSREKIIKSEQEVQHLSERLKSQKEELLDLQSKFKHDFENLAQKILEEKSKKFTEENKQNIDQILKPLDQKIGDFKKRVEDTYNQEARERHSLKDEVKRLAELNNVLSKEADNLTKALKGDVKKQGTWGEMILEKVLESSGLTEGNEFEREVGTHTDDGISIRPDVIVKLPDNKHIIIDSKFPLKAYNEYISEENDEQRTVFLKKHINAIQSHIKLLSEKKYQFATDKNTPDFVIMFLPVEAAFSLAISGADNLFSYAWDRKIVLVSPTTLLATLKTVASLWKHENQSKNALEIARQSGLLYDKFVGFLEDMEKIETQIDKLDTTYKSAKSKLKDGRGNLITKVEQIKQLGIKTQKKLPSSFDIDQDD